MLTLLCVQIFTELRPVAFFFGGEEPAITEDFAVSSSVLGFNTTETYQQAAHGLGLRR